MISIHTIFTLFVAGISFLCASNMAHAEVLRSAAEIESLPAIESSGGLKFDIHATVASPVLSHLADCNTLLVFDHSGGTVLQNHVTNHNPVIRAGDRIHATGAMYVYAGTTYVDCYTLDVESHGPAPQPVTATVRELFSGRYDYCLTSITGMVRDVFRDEIDKKFRYLLLDCDGETLYIPLRTRQYAPLEGKSVIGAKLAITGRCFAQDNGMRRRIGRMFKGEGNDCVTIISLPASGLFDSLPLEDCHRMRPSEIMALGRRRVAGTVTAVWNGSILLQTATDIFSRVDFAEDALPKYGDPIEIVGFPESDLYHINFTRAHWRPSSEGTFVQSAPTNISIKELMKKDNDRLITAANFHGRPIRIRGVVRSIPEEANPNKTLYVGSDQYIIPVDFSSCPTSCNGLTVGCEIEVSGTCVMDSENWRQNQVFPQLKSVFLVIRKPDDVRILSHPPWWTPGRLMVVLAVLLAVILAVAIWNRSLHALAERRGRELTKETISHVESELKVSERTRLAVELHDTLAQYLTGAIMEIRTGVRLGGALPSEAQEHFALSQKTLESCRQELRNCLWDLRNRALELPTMDAAIRQTLAPHVKNIDLAVRFNVPRETISDNTAHAILRIVRELVTNALRHGHATAIKIAGSVEGGKLLFSVKDNGCGFDPEGAPSIEDGHFGLQGIRERIAPFNGDFKIESASGKGAKATVSLTLPHSVHAPQPDNPSHSSHSSHHPQESLP